MALLDVLRERTAHKGRTAQVFCGKLGALTVEALPIAECSRHKDDRALFYAACRELQSAGEALRREGSLFRPDEVLEYLTEEETAAAANTIRVLSGLTAERGAPAESDPDVSEALAPEAEDEADAADVPSILMQETPAAAAAETPLAQSVSGAPVFPRFSAQQETAPGRPSLQAAGAAEAVFPLLQEAAELSGHISAGISHVRRQAEQPPYSPQTAESLAENAAEILARELRRAALVR